MKSGNDNPSANVVAAFNPAFDVVDGASDRYKMHAGSQDMNTPVNGRGDLKLLGVHAIVPYARAVPCDSFVANRFPSRIAGSSSQW
jgi:hypothetical protein